MQTFFNKRIAAFDNLRALLVLVGFPIHTVFFLALNFRVVNTSSQISVEHLTLLLSTPERIFFLGIYYFCVFMMPTFFLLAGFFGHLSYQHRGELTFITHRLYKIALPFLWCVFWSLPLYFVFFALCRMFPDVVSMRIRDFITNQYIANGSWLGIINHLRETWFLYDLLWFYALTVAMMRLKNHSHYAALFFMKIDACLSRLFASRWLYVGVALLGSLLLSQEENIGWRSSIFTLVPSFGFLAYYGVWYGLGWWLWRHQNKFGVFFKRNGLKVLLSIVLYGVFVAWYFSHLAHDGFFNRNVGVFIYELSAAFVTLALFGGAWHSVRKSNKILRYISQASYWLYLVQIPIIMPCVFFNNGQHDSFVIAAIKISVISTLIALLSYQLLVRHTWLSNIFGGKS